MAKVRIESLSPEIKQLLGYDARLATQQNERDTADNARRAQAAQAAASKLASKLETLHGIVVRNSTKGIVIETRKSTGEKRSVSEWSNNNNRLERREEEVYQTVHYCVCGIPNAEYIKPGTRFDIEVLPEKLDYIDGSPIMVATFIRELK